MAQVSSHVGARGQRLIRRNMEERQPNRTNRVYPGEEVLRQVRTLYDQGRCVAALAMARGAAPLREWGGVDACLLAARLAANTGAPRLASRLVVRAWRSDRASLEAREHYGLELLGHRGPVAVWRFLRAQPTEDARPDQQAALLALRARVAGLLRDFDAAESLLEEATTSDPGNAWVRLQRAFVLECQDRPEEALEEARAAGRLHPFPFYRPSVQTVAHLLQALDRDEEAIQWLGEAGSALESGPLSAQLYSLLSETGQWAAAEVALERCAALSPLLEPGGVSWLGLQRARVAYHLGRRSEAASFARGVDDDFGGRFAERLAEPWQAGERIQLDVGFVRQHFKTCAPATLAALGRYWGMPAEHLQLAAELCYDGTPSWQQRRWAERNGWHVRDFRVTWDSALALLQRGVPFAISVVEATSAHLMAVVGLDRVRGTFLFRDPAQPYVVEAEVGPFLERYGAFGPHGAVFVPERERARVEGIELPDAVLYDHYHEFCLRLEEHDRAGAVDAVAAMEAVAAEARLTLHTRWHLAVYDANRAAQARWLEPLRGQFPDSASLALRHLGCLGSASRKERLEFLRQACANPKADSALLLALAGVLQEDARCLPEARRWLKRAQRPGRIHSSATRVLADQLWREGALEEATECYRFAANLEQFDEGLYQTWFTACRQTRRTDEALRHLQGRFARFGSRSSQPALTLAWAWREMDQPDRARKVLEEAGRLRPDDGQLLLRTACLLASLGEATVAHQRLQAARGRVRENDWLRARAEIAEVQGDFGKVLDVSREWLKREPLALEAHAAVARTLARLEGPESARKHLLEACSRFTHHCALHRMLVEWSRGASLEVMEAAVRTLLRLEPADAWAQRELAMVLVRNQRGEAALAEAEEAARIEPDDASSHFVLGWVHQHEGRVDLAREAFRRAVVRSVDHEEAITGLLALAQTDADRKDDLAFVERELVRQVVSGDGLLTFLTIAREVLDAGSLGSILSEAHRQRPDLWHAWAALASHLGHTGRLEEALQLLVQACELFPHLPRIWLERAEVHRWRREPEAEVQAAQRAVEINPAWGRAAMALARVLERGGRLDEARQVYERAIFHAPQDASLHRSLASLLWRQRQVDDAFQSLERAIRLVPGYEPAWGWMSDWSTQNGRPERTLAFARELVREHAGSAHLWLILARALDQPGGLAERLAAVDRALELDPRFADAWDAKVEFLALAERFEDAIRVCTEAVVACPADSHVFRGRRAWVEARRNEMPEAIRLMRAVLADNAGYVWGWDQLASWLLGQGNLADAAAALEQLQRLRPHDAWVSRQLGFLRLEQKDLAAAQTAFANALASCPTDGAAAHNLFDLQLRSGEVAAAAATVGVMQTHQPGAATLAAEIVLRLRQKNTSAALRIFETLCSCPEPDPWAVGSATGALQEADLGREALRIAKRAARSGFGNPETGAAVIGLLLPRRAILAASWFFLRLRPGETQRRAAEPLVQGLARNRAEMVLRFLLWRRRDVLFRDDAAWAQVGFAWTTFGRMGQAVRWLADWQQRAEVQPWVVFNLCLALRHLGRYGEANALARQVLQAWGHREGAADMHLFLAVEEALTGDLPAAQEHLERAVVRPDVIHDQQLLALAKALVELQQAAPAERRKVFRSLRGPLAARFSLQQTAKSMRDVRRTFRRTGRAFHELGAGEWAWLWFQWRLYWHLLPLLPLAVVLAYQFPLSIGVMAWGFWKYTTR